MFMGGDNQFTSGETKTKLASPYIVYLTFNCNSLVVAYILAFDKFFYVFVNFKYMYFIRIALKVVYFF